MDAARAELAPKTAGPQPPETRLVRRVAAFDVGDRRIGVAVSDPLGYTAQPLSPCTGLAGRGAAAPT